MGSGCGGGGGCWLGRSTGGGWQGCSVVGGGCWDIGGGVGVDGGEGGVGGF